MNEATKKQDIESLLPFYLNRTLQGEEKIAVEQALVNDKSLQQELAFLQGLQTHIKQQAEENSPGELGLKRLQRSLKQQQAEKDTAKDVVPTPEQSFNYWRMATIAACLTLAVQTASNLYQSDTYQAAGGQTTTQHKGKLVSVTFTPNATEQSIRKLLLETNASIVEGPSALGIYRLSVSGNAESSINKLKVSLNVIESLQQE